MIFIACALHAQQVEILAPQEWVFSGGTVQLGARVLDDLGELVPDAAVDWRSSNSAIVSVTADGVVSGGVLGRAEIQAVYGNVAAKVAVSVHPRRIAIQPRRVEINLGGDMALAAQAFNSAGQPIGGLAFTWSSNLPSVVSISEGGVARGVSAGQATLTARIAGLEPDVAYTAQTTATVRLRPTYRVERLVSSDQSTRPVSLRRIDEISFAGDDRMAFQAALSNGAMALMQYDGTNLQVRTMTGDVPAQVVSGLGGASINATGDILARIWSYFAHPGEGRLLRRGRTLEEAEIFNPPQECCYCCFNIGPRSLGDNGDFVYWPNNSGGQELLLRRVDGRVDRVYKRGDPLPGFGQAQWLYAEQLEGGRILMSANAPGQWAWYEWDGRQFRRLYGNSGDSFNGRSIFGGSRPIRTPAGDYYAFFHGYQFSAIGRLSGGAWTSAFPFGQPQPSGITIWHPWDLYAARSDDIVFSGPSDQGGGLFRWRSGALEILAKLGGPGEWRWIEQAFFSPRGGVIAKGPADGAATRVARIEPGRTATLFETGRPIDAAAPTAVSWDRLQGSLAAGGLLVNSFAQGVLRITRDAAQPVLGPGDPLSTSDLLRSIWYRHAAANGDNAMIAGTTGAERLLLYRNGSVRDLAGQGPLDPRGQCCVGFCCGPVAINQRGQVATRANFSPSGGLLLFTDVAGAPYRVVIQHNTPAPGGANYTNVREIAIDDNGRVAFLADRSAGNIALYLWENGQARRIALAGENSPSGPRSQWIAELRAAGDRIYARFDHQNSNVQEYAEYDGTQWRTRLTVNQRLSFGSTINWFHNGGQFRPLPSGDIAFTPGLADSGPSVVVSKRDGRDFLVARSGEQASNGDWISRIFDLAIGADGQVAFAASNLGSGPERISLYLAGPQ
ncbi:MAG: Ig-like domain-containing protein [Bryobacteraceae bacterium]